jgi:hypothetical protein
VAQDLFVERADGRRRNDTQLGVQQVAQGLIGGKGVGLASGQVAGPHQQGDERFAVRVRRHERPHLFQHVETEVEVRADPLFQGREPPLVQGLGGRGQCRAAQPVQRRAAPQGQRRTDVGGHQPVELRQVEPAPRQVERETGPAGRDHLVRSARRDQVTAQRRGRVADLPGGRRGRVGVPHGGGQLVDAHHAAGVEQQRGEDLALARAHDLTAGDVEWTQHAKSHENEASSTNAPTVRKRCTSSAGCGP